MTWWSKYLLLAKGGSDVLLSARNGMTNTGKRRSLKSTFVCNTVGFCLGYFEGDNGGAVLRTIKLAENVKPIEDARYNVSDIDTAATIMYETFADGSAIPAESMAYKGQGSAMNWCDRTPQNLHADPGNAYITASTVEDPTSPTGYATSAVVTPDTNDAWWGSVNIHVWNVFENYFMSATDIYVSVWAKGDGVNTLELEKLKYNTASNDLVAVHCNGEPIATSTTVTPTTEWQRYDFKFNFSATDYNNARIGYRFKPCVTDQTNGIIKITGVNITETPFANTSTVPNLMTAKHELRIPNPKTPNMTFRCVAKVLPNRGKHCYLLNANVLISLIFGSSNHQVATIDSQRVDGAYRVAKPTTDEDIYFSITVTPTEGKLYCNGQLTNTWTRNGNTDGLLGSGALYELGAKASTADTTSIVSSALLGHASDDATELAWTAQSKGGLI